MAKRDAMSIGGWGPRSTGLGPARWLSVPTPRRPRFTGTRRVHGLAAAIALLIVGWAIAGLAIEQIRFAVRAPGAEVGVEAASAFARFFGAVVLFLVPAGGAGRRLHWVAGGLTVLALGGLTFGYIEPLAGGTPDPNRLGYAAVVVWTVAGALLVLGLVPPAPPRFSARSMIAALAAVAVGVGGVAWAGKLPVLVRGGDPAAAIAGDAVLPGLTAWHWSLSVVPLGLATAAVAGAARTSATGGVGGWLVVAMVLLAGAQLHNLFWPAPFGPVLTTANVLRLAFAGVVAAGGVLELRRVAAEHAALLAAEREYSRRLVELSVLKTDFTAMIAHELGTPIAAVRRLVDVLAIGGDSPELRTRTVATMRAELDVVDRLVADVGTIANLERDDFAVRPFPVRLDLLLADAAAFARALPGDHPFTWSPDLRGKVLADPERIAQVLRNLVGNAAKHTPPGTPIELRATRREGRVRVEVVDRGPGVHPDDLPRIFEKFGRGRDEAGRRVSGVGLGLYVSRRIVRAHGAELTVASSPGRGSVFGFDLEVVA